MLPQFVDFFFPSIGKKTQPFVRTSVGSGLKIIFLKPDVSHLSSCFSLLSQDATPALDHISRLNDVAPHYVVLFSYPFSHPSLLIGVFNPVTFKVIIDRYIVITILLVIFMFFFKKILFIDREKGREGERDGEKH